MYNRYMIIVTVNLKLCPWQLVTPHLVQIRLVMVFCSPPLSLSLSLYILHITNITHITNFTYFTYFTNIAYNIIPYNSIQ